jgi:hypothetical protein
MLMAVYAFSNEASCIKIYTHVAGAFLTYTVHTVKDLCGSNTSCYIILVQ